MTNTLRLTTTFLSIYAGLIAIQHGTFEILQGSHIPSGLMFNAIGPPCQPETVWHACFPAITILPNLLVSGIAASLIGLGMAAWGLFFAHRRHGELVLGVLSLLALPFGGGFVPVFIGLAAAAAAAANRQSEPTRSIGVIWRILSALWPWSLVLLAAWFPGSWLLGHFFSETMLMVGGISFFVFDVGLPVLAVLSGYSHEYRSGR